MVPENGGNRCLVAADEGLVFIVGPNHFQNALLSACIEAGSVWKSRNIESVAGMFAENRQHGDGKKVVLLDCFRMNAAQLEAVFQSELEILMTGWPLVLFNVDRMTHVEKKALEYGVHGFFYQDDSVETLLKGLSAIFGGELWVSRQKMMEVILDNGISLKRNRAGCGVHTHNLTEREIELLGLLSLGASNDHIADKLFISPHTVRTHLHNIFRKIHAKNRLEASIWATKKLFAGDNP